MTSYHDYSPYNDRPGASSQGTDLSEFIMGNVVVLKLEVREAGTEQLVDPDQITLSIRKPGTSAIDIYPLEDITRDSLGTYHIDIRLTNAGIWAYRWDTTAPGEGSINGRFVVRSNAI